MNPVKARGPQVQITKDGPYVVSGKVPLSQEIIGTNEAGESTKWKHSRTYPSQERYALCRCGHSSNKPFCDGSHLTVGFDGTETAQHLPYLEQAKTLRGPSMSLTDVESLCSSARFCDPHGSVWKLVFTTDNSLPSKHFVKQTCACPSGRLVAWDNDTGKPIEPKFEPSIALIEDPSKACSGPLWLRGGLSLIGSDGFAYEVRNRMTVCRCGASRNKPFCDGTHISIGFHDEKGDEACNA